MIQEVVMRPGAYEVAKMSGVQGVFREVRSPRGGQLKAEVKRLGRGDISLHSGR